MDQAKYLWPDEVYALVRRQGSQAQFIAAVRDGVQRIAIFSDRDLAQTYLEQVVSPELGVEVLPVPLSNFKAFLLARRKHHQGIAVDTDPKTGRAREFDIDSLVHDLDNPLPL